MRRTLNLLSPKNPAEEEDALTQAQYLIYDAWELTRRRDRIQLAKQALKLSDLCADAHVILAEDDSSTYGDRLERFKTAVAAGERAIGSEIFENEVGNFWAILETRPYMRARTGLANCLWGLGEIEQAIGHYQDMLRLNPNDNQGLRHVLTGWLYAEGRLTELEKLLGDYEDELSAEWAYTKVLLACTQGEVEKMRSTLKYAWECNPHVPALLYGAKPMPKTLPEWYSPGAPDEAVLYVSRNQDNWQATKGALLWLEEAARDFRPPEEKSPEPTMLFS